MKKYFSLAAMLILGFLQIHAQSLDEIIDKYYAAIGGKDKIKDLKTVVMEGNISVQGMEIPITIYQAHNAGTRLEISVSGMTGYVVTTPTEGWTYLPFNGMTAPEAMSPDQVKESADNLDLEGPLMNFAEKGHQVEYLGKEDFEGTECYKLKVVLKGGMEMTMFIDPETNYLIKQVVKTKSGGQENEQVQTFSNFKATPEGLVFPYDMTGFGPGELSFTSIEVNKPIDDAKFKKSE